MSVKSSTELGRSLIGLALLLPTLPLAAQSEPVAAPEVAPAPAEAPAPAVVPEADSFAAPAPDAPASEGGEQAPAPEGGEQAPAPEAEAKKLGWSWAALPLANYNSDEGVGYGARVALYKVTPESDPYQHQLSLMLFFTTKKVMYHEAFWDAPNFRGSGVRLETRAVFDQTLLSNYYGIGNSVAPVYPGMDEIDPTTEAGAEQDEVASRYYTLYTLQQPTFSFYSRKDLFGNVKLFTAARYKYTVVTPFDAQRVQDLIGVTLPDDYTTLLEEQQPYGYSGGSMGNFQVGFIRDSRDMEPSPTRGAFSEGSLRTNLYGAADSAEADGTNPLFWGMNLTTRRYFSPVPSLVLALRFAGDVMFGDVPFWELSKFGGSRDYQGIGGSIALRGILANHYVGQAKVIWGPELRLTPLHIPIKGNVLDITAAGFVDSGRVWATLGADPPKPGIHSSVGGGLRFAWNNNFLVRFDMARSITDDDPMGIYLVFDHAY